MDDDLDAPQETSQQVVTVPNLPEDSPKQTEPEVVLPIFLILLNFYYLTSIID